MAYEVYTTGVPAKPLRAWLVTVSSLSLTGVLAMLLVQSNRDPAARLGWLIRFEVPPALRLTAAPQTRETVLAYEASADPGRRGAGVLALVYVQEFQPATAVDFDAALTRCIRNALGPLEAKRTRTGQRRGIQIGGTEGMELRFSDDIVLIARACAVAPDRVYVWVLKSVPASAANTELLLDRMTESARVVPALDRG
ncbi:MAG: hypothetical protein IT449_03415 [Phycisphaerales bacterium]|nr:hypothetical protein [Phycisphaerales bacterium]